ncbi:hypothetical protein, partial [Rhodococcus jostii]|uniref:hypothetical protein n=1 Tax=Rhodococcus jostii TaxID=132919 RepID=UPI00364515A0
TTLVAWVRHVCESRRVDYDGRDGTLGVARWLDRNIIALAMTEGSGEALDEIQYAMRRARWATDRPAAKRYSGTLEEARDTELNAVAIERMRCELGDEYGNLTARRIRTLLDRNCITPVRFVPTPDGDLAVYRLGDVLDAHLAYPARSKVTRRKA